MRPSRTMLTLVTLTILGVALNSSEASAQYVQQPSTGISVQYIPGMGAVLQNRYYDPTRGSTTSITHSYYGSTFNRTFGNPVYRTIWVDRWVMTPYGPQLIRQPVTVPVYQ